MFGCLYMSLTSTKNNTFLIEVFNYIFDNKLILIKMFVHVGPFVGEFVGEITILFESMLWLRSKKNVKLSHFL